MKWTIKGQREILQRYKERERRWNAFLPFPKKPPWRAYIQNWILLQKHENETAVRADEAIELKEGFVFVFPLSVKVHVSTFLGAFHFLNICHHAPSKYNLMSTSVRQLPQVVQFHPRRAEAQWRSQRSQKGNSSHLKLMGFSCKVYKNMWQCNYIVRAPPWKVCAREVLWSLIFTIICFLFLTCVTGIILIKLLERIEWGRFTQTLWNERLLGN